MARPLKQGLDYFPHDTDARNDRKVRRLRAIYKLAGYGVYMCILEMLYSEPSLSLNLSDKNELKVVADDLHLRPAKLKIILDKCAELSLIDAEKWRSSLTVVSFGVIKRSQLVLDKRAEARAKYAQTTVVSDAETNQETHQEIGGRNDTNKIKLNKKEIESSSTGETTATDLLKKDDGWAKVCTLYENTWGLLNAGIVDALKADVYPRFSPENFERAIKKARLEATGRFSLKYILTILERAEREGWGPPQERRQYGVNKKIPERVTIDPDDERYGARFKPTPKRGESGRGPVPGNTASSSEEVPSTARDNG